MPFSLGYWATAGAGGGGGGAGAYEQIATAFGTGSSGTITFDSIPQGYKHLQLRYTGRNTTTGNSQIFLRMNNVSTTVYSAHSLLGNGSTVTSPDSQANATEILFFEATMTSSNPQDAFHAGVIDLLDYASTSKNKTLRALYGGATAFNRICLRSGVFRSTAAVSRIDLITSGGFYTSTSRFSLYGIKG